MTDSPTAAHTHDGTPCDDAVAELYRYLDGELSDDIRTNIEGHLRRCSPCLEAFDFEVELRKVIVARNSEVCPEALKARILALLDGTASAG